MEITRELARYVISSDFNKVPVSARREAIRSLVNWVGCAVGGARHDAVERALAALAEFSTLPQATVLGRRERLDLLHATLVNQVFWGQTTFFTSQKWWSVPYLTYLISPAVLLLVERLPLA